MTQSIFQTAGELNHVDSAAANMTDIRYQLFTALRDKVKVMTGDITAQTGIGHETLRHILAASISKFTADDLLLLCHQVGLRIHFVVKEPA